jgi:predicted RNase H-like HicB family nuclease
MAVKNTVTQTTFANYLRFLAMIPTKHSYRGYVFVITYRPEDPAYGVDYPDWPEIITSGNTLAQAFANACEALDLHLESLAKMGRKPRKPRHYLVMKSA